MSHSRPPRRSCYDDRSAGRRRRCRSGPRTLLRAPPGSSTPSPRSSTACSGSRPRWSSLILVLVDSMSALDRSCSRAASIGARCLTDRFRPTPRPSTGPSSRCPRTSSPASTPSPTSAPRSTTSRGAGRLLPHGARNKALPGLTLGSALLGLAMARCAVVTKQERAPDRTETGESGGQPGDDVADLLRVAAGLLRDAAARHEGVRANATTVEEWQEVLAANGVAATELREVESHVSALLGLASAQERLLHYLLQRVGHVVDPSRFRARVRQCKGRKSGDPASPARRRSTDGERAQAIAAHCANPARLSR